MPRAAAPAPAPAAAAAGVPNLLAMVKWETVANMLHWKHEMSRFDDLLRGLGEVAAA